MKRLVLLVSLVLGLSAISKADGPNPSLPSAPAPAAPPTVVSAGPGAAPVSPAVAGQSSIYYHIGALNLTIPWDNVNAVYMYDLNAKRNLVGGEAGIASLWIIQATVGAVTSIDGNGAPYVGGNLWLPNPIPQLAILNYIKPGVFGGYDWNRGASIFGFKAAIPLFD